MKKGKGKRTVLAWLLAFCMVVMLLPAAAFAASEDGSGEQEPVPPQGSKYQHTYHTNVKSEFTIHYLNGDKTVCAESGFVKGSVSDDALQKIIAQQKTDIKKKLASGYSLTDDSIVQSETSLVLDHFESANITTDQGESIFDVHEYQVYNVKYDVYPVHADIEDGVIKAIRIDNAKLAFQPGEAPQFTATVAAGYENLYELYCQDWSVGPWTSDALKVHASNNPEKYAFKTFEKGQKYSYSVFVRLTSDNTKEYRFAEDAKLILNGKEVTYSSKSVRGNYIDFYDVAEMSPAEEVVPDPGNTDQGKDSNAAGRTDAKAQKSDSAAKTGDDASPLLWAGILLLAAVSGGTAVLYRRKAKN